MSASATIESVGALQRALDEFSTEYADLEHLVDGLFDQLDGLNDRLNLKAEELSGQRMLVEQRETQIADRESKLAEQREENARMSDKLDQQEARLGEALDALNDLKARLSSQAVVEPGANVAVAFDEERDALRQHLAAANDELSRLSGLAADLAQMREELLQSRMTSTPDGAGAAPEELVELEKERDTLVAELELVRSRAAQLQDVVEEQKREMAVRHTETTEELRRLRELVERHSDQIGSQPSVHTAPKESAPDTAAPSSSDPVVNSVMAQFAKIQKDVHRRKNKR